MRREWRRSTPRPANGSRCGRNRAGGMLTWQAAALAVSIFNAIICLWLGTTVILDGGRERGPQLAAAGMVMAGVFFLIHAAVIGRSPPLSGVGLPFWWRVI